MMSTELSLTAARELSDLTIIGEGGFGKVFKAKHSTHGIVAYKRMDVGFIKETDSSVKAMQQEARVQSKLRHQNVLMLLAMVFETENYGIVLEYAKYGDLKEFLYSFQNKVTWQFKVRIALDVAIGMCHLHSNSIFHGDLKIQNILICDGFKAKVSDFGLSRWKEYSRSKSKKHHIGGTVTHTSPERWKNVEEPLNSAHDVYGYGVLLWEISTELIPFANANPSMICAYVLNGTRPALAQIPKVFPETYINVMTSSWSPSPEDRPQFVEIKNEFESLTASLQQDIDDAEFQLHEQEKDRRCCRRTESRELENNGSVASCTSDFNRLGIVDIVIRPREPGASGANIPCISSHAQGASAGIAFSTAGDHYFTEVDLMSLHSNPLSGVNRMDTQNLAVTGISTTRTGTIAIQSDLQVSVRATTNDGSLTSTAAPGASTFHRSQSEMNTTTDAVVNTDSSWITGCQTGRDNRPVPSETTQIVPSHQNLQHPNPIVIHRSHQFNPERTSADIPTAVKNVKTAPAAVLMAISRSADDRNVIPFSRPPELSCSSAPYSTTSSCRTVNRTYTPGQEIHINAGDGNGVYIFNGAGSSGNKIFVSSQGPGHSSSKHQAKPVTTSEPKPKKKIVVADKIVDPATLQLVSLSIGKDWKSLGRELRIEDSELDSLSYNLRHEGPLEIAYQVLRHWYEKYGKDAKLEVLAKALVRIKRGDVAEKLGEL